LNTLFYQKKTSHANDLMILVLHVSHFNYFYNQSFVNYTREIYYIYFITYVNLISFSFSLSLSLSLNLFDLKLLPTPYFYITLKPIPNLTKIHFNDIRLEKPRKCNFIDQTIYVDQKNKLSWLHKSQSLVFSVTQVVFFYGVRRSWRAQMQSRCTRVTFYNFVHIRSAAITSTCNNIICFFSQSATTMWISIHGPWF
jgi:hypothetical protein